MFALLFACATPAPSGPPDPPAVDRAVVAEVPPVETDCFADGDGDGWGGAAQVVEGASCEAGTVATGGDCDDADATRSPGEVERCDGRDDDCDGAVDQPVPADAPAWYADRDGDGFGDPAVRMAACDPPDPYVADATDCDDAAADAFPGGVERCEDGLDNDCAGDGDGLCRLSGDLRLDDITDATWRGESEHEALGLAEYPGDLDLDGSLDVLAASWSADRAVVFRGFTAPLTGGTSADATLTLQPSAGVYWEADAVVADAPLEVGGCGAVVLGGERGDPGPGAVWILSGCAGTRSEADAVVEGAEADAGLFGAAVAAIPDGAGAAELLVGAPGSVMIDGASRDEHGRVYLFQDPLNELDAVDADARFDTPATAEWMALGQRLCAADFDGDGLSDAAMSAPRYDLFRGGALPSWAPNGAVFVAFAPFAAVTALAGEDGTAGDSVAVYTSDTTAGRLGSELACGGDLDGDGLPELVIGDPDRYASGGRVYVAMPRAPGSAPAADLATQFSGSASYESLGGVLASAGDLDGDGRDDVALRAMNEAGTDGVVHLFYSAGAGLRTTADADATLAEGTSVGVADVNADGVADLAIGDAGDSTVAEWSGAVELVLGGRLEP